MEQMIPTSLSLSVFVCSIIPFVKGTDPCATTNYLTDWRRSLAFRIDSDKLCDNALEAGWYRITSGQGDKMPTECVQGGFRCNTAIPIWLSNETIGAEENIFPSIGEEVNRTAYGAHYNGKCNHTTYDIKIKGCNDFLVYHLVPASSCSSAYCFGTEQPCPQGESSDTDFSPGCGEYPKITVSPFVKVTQEETKILNMIYSKVKFECHANDLQADYLYDVRWYINGVEVKEARTFNLTKNDIANGLGAMKEDHWTSKYRPNFIVNCSVKVRGNGFGSPSPEHRSEQFFAGIKIIQGNNYVVEENSKLSIPIFLTIPVSCRWTTLDNTTADWMKNECVVNLVSGIPNYQRDPNSCIGGITDNSLIFHNLLCGVTFYYSNWTETKYLQITGAVDNIINIKDRIVFLRLYNRVPSSADASLYMWKNITLPDLKVTIVDTEKKIDAKGCWSLNDPHMFTFDRRTNWELQQAIGGGEYIMYLHNRLPIQINAYFRACNGAALCNCGLAVRSGDSLFVANFCETVVEQNGISKRKLNRYVIQRLCDDQSLIVTENGNKIEVTLPTGTKVHFSHGKVYNFYGLNGIHIYPSSLDTNLTKGLCGIYNGDPSDDFTEYKSFTTAPSTTKFAQSWKVSGKDANLLLKAYTLFDPAGKIRQAEYYAETYCTCKVNLTTQYSNESPSYNCDLKSSMEICRKEKTTKSVYTASCSNTVQRTKRSIGNHITKRSIEDDIEEDEQPSAYAMVSESEQYNGTEEWRNGWTEVSATEFCIRNMQNSPAFVPCSEFVPSSNPDSIIDNCVLDIKLQGDSGWIEATLQNFADSCLTQASRMENLTETNSTNTNGQEKSIFSIIAESTCPGNCSEHGICKDGLCNCTTGHYGPACAQDIADPPSIEADAFEGSCDPTKKPCKKFIIPGTQFIDDTLTCRFSPFSIIKNETTSILVKGDSFTYPGTYGSDFFMYCELPASRPKRSLDSSEDLHGYNISVSNNGVEFTEELTTIIYNKLCYDCNVTSSISCVKLETCPTRTVEPPGESKLSTLVIVLIVLSSLVLMISIGLVSVRKKLRCRKREPYVSDISLEVTHGPVEK